VSKGYSKYIIPLSIFVHLLLLNTIYYVVYFQHNYDLMQIAYLNISWLLIAYFVKFYGFNRLTTFVKLGRLIVLQYVIFLLASFAFFGVLYKEIKIKQEITFLLIFYIAILIFRTIYFLALRKYRVEGGSFKNVVLVGAKNHLNDINKFFDKRPDLGYQIKHTFSKENYAPNSNGEFVQSCFSFIKENDIDEVYCAVSDLSKSEINSFIDFTDRYCKSLKLLPATKEAFNTSLTLDYYDVLPVLSVRKSPFENKINKVTKRLFDIVFSLVVIIFILSWLTPLLFILIKLESKGPLIFKQKRDGLNGHSFNCYKFRSMRLNGKSNTCQTTKNDERVTKIGCFLRKTSLDELPQFFNVLIGNMCVVGPRPHMLSQRDLFLQWTKKYMIRHLVKPGITGLAQVRGYRGEIHTKQDIENRVRYDIFYIENWSLFLDIRIIFQTVKGVVLGDEKAY